MSPQPNTASLTGAIDSPIALVLAMGVVFWANQQRMPQGALSEFLKIRVAAMGLTSLYGVQAFK
jgi:hypothetical protein